MKRQAVAPEKGSSTAALLDAIDAAKIKAPDVAGTLRGILKERAQIMAELRERMATDAKEHEAAMEKQDRDTATELGRLRSDTAAKESRIREIESKFSFVVGTVKDKAKPA